MRRVIVFVVVLLGVLTQTAFGLREFRKGFEKQYADLYENEVFKATFKKAKCNLCHLKGEKKEVNNPYGDALAELIEGDANKRLKAAKKEGRKSEELEALLAELSAALEQVESLESPDGQTFGERLRAGLTPVVIPEGDDDEEEEE